MTEITSQFSPLGRSTWTQWGRARGLGAGLWYGGGVPQWRIWMTTPDWTSEIVEAMARAFRTDMDEQFRGYPLSTPITKRALEAALTAALPMILEKAAKECDDQSDESDKAASTYDGGAGESGYRLGCYDCEARIRALAEPKDNGGKMAETLQVRARKMTDALQRDHSNMPFRDDAVADLLREATAKLDEYESRLPRPDRVSEEAVGAAVKAAQNEIAAKVTGFWNTRIDDFREHAERAVAAALGVIFFNEEEMTLDEIRAALAAASTGGDVAGQIEGDVELFENGAEALADLLGDLGDIDNPYWETVKEIRERIAVIRSQKDGG